MFNVLLLGSTCTSLSQWCIFLVCIQVLICLVSTTISTNISAHCIDYSKRLSVLTKFLYGRVFINSASLPLASKKLFQWVLTYAFTEEASYSQQRKEIVHQFNERQHCQVKTNLKMSQCNLVPPKFNVQSYQSFSCCITEEHLVLCRLAACTCCRAMNVIC